MAENRTLMDPETGELLYATVLEYGDHITTEVQRAGAAGHFGVKRLKGAMPVLLLRLWTIFIT